METWNQRYEKAARIENKEIEARYGIKIGQTDIHCAFCDKQAGFFHICPSMDLQRREKVEEIKEEFERPISLMGVDGWRLELGIEIGMSKREALEKFLEWQVEKKTCQRCSPT